MADGIDISLDMKVEIKEEFSPNNTVTGSFGKWINNKIANR